MRSSELEGTRPSQEIEGQFSYIDAFVKGCRDEVLLTRTEKKFSVGLVVDIESGGAYVAHYLFPAYNRADPLMDMEICFFDLEKAKAYALVLITSWNRDMYKRSNGGKSINMLPSCSFHEDASLNQPQWEREDGKPMSKGEIDHFYNNMSRLLDVGNMVNVDDIIATFSSAQSSLQQ